MLKTYLVRVMYQYSISCFATACTALVSLLMFFVLGVRLKENKYPEVFLNGVWSPICGYNFWDFDSAANLFCKKLTSNPDATGTVKRRTDKPLESDAIRVGFCLDSDPWLSFPLSCSGGNNYFETDKGCEAGQPASMEIECTYGKAYILQGRHRRGRRARAR